VCVCVCVCVCVRSIHDTDPHCIHYVFHAFAVCNTPLQVRRFFDLPVIGVGSFQRFNAIFTAINKDKNDYVSWDEFMRFFCGRKDAKKVLYTCVHTNSFVFCVDNLLCICLTLEQSLCNSQIAVLLAQDYSVGVDEIKQLRDVFEHCDHNRDGESMCLSVCVSMC